MAEGRYFLSAEALRPLPSRKKFMTKQLMLGPFVSPAAAREFWKNTFKNRAAYRNVMVLYKEFDLTKEPSHAS